MPLPHGSRKADPTRPFMGDSFDSLLSRKSANGTGNRVRDFVPRLGLAESVEASMCRCCACRGNARWLFELRRTDDMVSSPHGTKVGSRQTRWGPAFPLARGTDRYLRGVREGILLIRNRYVQLTQYRSCAIHEQSVLGTMLQPWCSSPSWLRGCFGRHQHGACQQASTVRGSHPF